MSSCIIIGGGVSGLAAAVDLASSGVSVTLLEQRRRPGGRVSSTIDPQTGDAVDNGQHLMLGCYKQTFDYLKTIGTFDSVVIEPSLKIPFHDSSGRTYVLDCPSLPAPYHLLAGLLRLKSISFWDRAKIIRILPDLLARGKKTGEELEYMTVDEWLNRCGQSDRMKESLWNLIAIATLNDNPRVLSAKIFLNVLRTAFLGERTGSSFVLPRVGLSDLFVEGALGFLHEHGAEVLTGKDVEGFTMKEGRIDGVRCRDGSYYFADAIVSSVPYYALKELLDASYELDDILGLSRILPLFTSSPILSIHLWFDRMVMEERFAGLLGSMVHWVFNKNELFGKPAITSQYLSLVISGAEEHIWTPNETLVERAVGELRSAFPMAGNARLLRSIVIKERRATFSARCGIDKYRPATRTAIPNFFLAGDWTATGLPATIEGAIKSGYEAANEVKGSR